MLVYDLEIVRAIPPRDGRLEPGVDYCGGWEDHGGMGISVICAYDYDTDRYRVFCADNSAEFAALAAKHDLLVGFNNVNFDNRVLLMNGIELETQRSYDILRELWRAAGLGPKFDYRTHGGFTLDATAAANLGYKKTGHGAHAPVAWQQGKVGEVIDYCLMDVKLTVDVLDRIVLRSELVSPKDGRVLAMRTPWAFRDTIGQAAR